MEAYFAAKQLLFTPEVVPAPQFALLNTDDEWSRRLDPSPESEVSGMGSINSLRESGAH